MNSLWTASGFTNPTGDSTSECNSDSTKCLGVRRVKSRTPYFGSMGQPYSGAVTGEEVAS